MADGLGLAGEERVAFERQARPDVDATSGARAVAPRARPPVALDSFVDDGTSLDELLALVGDRGHRLITLIGPGGVGKTRLALEVAQRLDGPVAFVALASLSDASLLAATVGDVLGAEHGPTRTHLQSLVVCARQFPTERIQCPDGGTCDNRVRYSEGRLNCHVGPGYAKCASATPGSFCDGNNRVVCNFIVAGEDSGGYWLGVTPCEKGCIEDAATHTATCVM